MDELSADFFAVYSSLALCGQIGAGLLRSGVDRVLQHLPALALHVPQGLFDGLKDGFVKLEADHAVLNTSLHAHLLRFASSVMP